MTTTAPVNPAAVETRVDAAGRPPVTLALHRYGYPVALTAGSLLIYASSALHPGGGEGDTAFVHAIRPHLDRWILTHLASWLGFTLLAVGVLGVLRLVTGRGRVPTAIGVLLTFAGGIGFGLTQVVHGFLEYAMDVGGVTTVAESVRVQEHFFHEPVWGVVSMVPMLLELGLLVLAIGIWRAGVVPRWAALLVLVTPVTVAFGGEGPAALLGVLPVTVGMLVLARALARTEV